MPPKREVIARREKPEVEVLPAVVEVLPPVRNLPVEIRKNDLDRLVKQQVAEVLAHQDGRLMPLFRSRQVANELRRLQTVPERRVASIEYDRYGCIHCHQNTRPHYANSFCDPCYHKILNRRKGIVKELSKGRER